MFPRGYLTQPALELFPGIIFGKTYYMDSQHGIFPRQANGPGFIDSEKEYQITPIAVGKKLMILPESERQRMLIETENDNTLQLIDGRAKHNNGWFVVRALVAKGATKNAIVWKITPHAIPGWKHEPVVQLSQVGYHPNQQKLAVIETDLKNPVDIKATLLRISENGGFETALEATPKVWGKFLRYNALQFDFTSITKPGMYVVKYANYTTEPFMINKEVYKRNVWQPTLEYFLPAQMCHMRVNDRYKVWHGFCHMDDARMAPTDLNHFDGYLQGPTTLSKFKSGERVPNVNVGGWHDAGDFDLRIESQAQTIHGLSQAYEAFQVKYDNTTINQQTRVVEVSQPDGKADILQQIEHGALPMVGGYNSLGRLYRGIICPTLRQYVLLGDPTNMTDNNNFNNSLNPATAPAVGLPGSPDDRWIFTEQNTLRELEAAAALAATSRTMKGFNDTLSVRCLEIAKELWNVTKETDPLQRLKLAVELYTTTKEKKYADFLIANTEKIVANIDKSGWIVGPVLASINNKNFTEKVRVAVKGHKSKIDEKERKSPYGLPYEPDIWGAGWGIQNFGVEQYYLHVSFPDIFPSNYMMHAMNFVLGCHPGTNTASFASGVGSNSLTTAYGFNRDDWSYIPGGVGSGTALIRPDFPELLTWPYLWQQTEYVLGGGTTDYLFLILAADHLLNK